LTLRDLGLTAKKPPFFVETQSANFHRPDYCTACLMIVRMFWIAAKN
jgi:hypothetical protein